MEEMTAYLAPKGFTAELHQELEDITRIEEVYDRLILTSGPLVRPAWAQNIWLNPRKIEIQSITQGAQALKQIQRNWVLYSVQSHRRAELISQQLPKITFKPLDFPTTLPSAPLGSWSLLSNNLVLASPDCSSSFPNGEAHFKEDKNSPPSRAYLKLWEGLAIGQAFPKAGEVCLDMGSCPGGWTWALQRLGAKVISVDKSPIAPEIEALPGVTFLKKDAFKLAPESIGPIDWFFSDVICYPQKLYELVQKWLLSGMCPRFLCTIKFQGNKQDASDREAIRALANIPGSVVQHLYHNKHELTWSLNVQKT